MGSEEYQETRICAKDAARDAAIQATKTMLHTTRVAVLLGVLPGDIASIMRLSAAAREVLDQLEGRGV